MSQVRKLLILELQQCNLCQFSVILGTFWSKTLDLITMAAEVKIKELSINYFVLGENNQVQKVSSKSETA